MKFIKLRIKNREFGKRTWEKEFHEYWCLLLQNEKEVMTYMELDADMYSKALLSMRREENIKEGKLGNIRLDHLSANREHVLATYVSYKALTAKEGELVWPHQVLSEIVTGKGKAMLKAVSDGPLQINMAGGWSHHKAFMDLWKPEVIAEVERDTCAFPIDEPPVEAKVLILENGTSVSDSIYNYAKKLTGGFGYPHQKNITQLKEKDVQWICKSITLSKNIVLETQAVDQLQLDSFMKFFTTIEGKEIHIRTTNKDAITSHPLFEINNNKHTIIFF